MCYESSLLVSQRANADGCCEVCACVCEHFNVKFVALICLCVSVWVFVGMTVALVCVLVKAVWWLTDGLDMQSGHRGAG